MIAVWIGCLLPLAMADPWWSGFDDPGLHEVMDRTLSGNLDLQGAWTRVAQAEARANQMRAGMLPSVSFDVSGGLGPIDALGFGGGMPIQADVDTYQSGSAMLNAVLTDTDNRLGWQAGRYDVLAQQGNVGAQALVLVTLAAEGWYDLVAATQRLAIVEEQLLVGQELLELVELRYAQGDGNALEVLQQRQQLAAKKTLLPTARIGVRTAEQRLALLWGETSSQAQLPQVGVALPSLPVTPEDVDLVQTRPDLVAAAATLQSATAQRKSTVRSALPTLAVSGAAGWQFFRVEELDTQGTWLVGASLSVPLFGGLGVWNGFEEARATEYGAQLAFQSLLLTAEQEVAQARVIETERAATLEAVQARIEAAELLYTESRSRYVQGLSDYLTVLVALDSRQQAVLDLLQAERDLLSARIQLHDALGGHWTSELNAPFSTGSP